MTPLSNCRLFARLFTLPNKANPITARLLTLLCCAIASTFFQAPCRGEEPLSISTFALDVTIPLDHRCMGVLPTKSKEIVDPLEARGFILWSSDKPIVYVAVDWCEIRNGSYDRWRKTIADAVDTTPDRVLVSSLHQHDAPVVDEEAQALLNSVGLRDELFHEKFHEAVLSELSAKAKASAGSKKKVTHFGFGKAVVQGVASSRRVVYADGKIDYNRYSASGADPILSKADDGPIDPYLRTLSFWNEDKPLVALHVYATHPMSYYGKGGVSSDFVGLARRRMQNEIPDAFHIYGSGCSGDVTAGKYNDGTPDSRAQLTEHLFLGMKEAWQQTKKIPATSISFQKSAIQLNYIKDPRFTKEKLEETLHCTQQSVTDRIMAAMSLASLKRVEAKREIEVPAIDFGGKGKLLLLPGESFVGYQLFAQKVLPDEFVVTVGYGECWPGYVPTQQAFDEKFDHDWRWVDVDAPGIMERGIEQALRKN